eukprot:TRINITY_DN11243_c0_g1_i1.p1 TRINITY_DN11243_c0_g1~~TRINITY_DN11243_c0_g1_i1.p1  ORF type:complete len:164 (+),score=23.90 TRINITY_DN11243_c0_g1_i1:85-576(+)
MSKPGTATSNFAYGDADDLPTSIPCNDFTAYKQALNKLRKLDDRVQFDLNRVDAREEDKVDCATLWERIEETSKLREGGISNCISTTQDALDALAEERRTKPDEIDEINREAKEMQSSLSFMKSDLEIEKILGARTVEQFRRGCPGFKMPRTKSSSSSRDQVF